MSNKKFLFRVYLFSHFTDNDKNSKRVEHFSKENIQVMREHMKR